MAGPRNTAFLHVLLVVTATWRLSIGQTNLLVNPSFEDDLGQGWKSNGFTFERITTDVKDGTYAAKCSGRDSANEGPITRAALTFSKGRHYEFDGYAKMLNDIPGKLWQNFKVTISMNFPDGGSQGYIISYRGFANVAKGWIRINGSLEAPQKEPLEPKLAIKGPDPGVDFLLDGLALYEVPENPNWRAESDTTIEDVRKSNITVNLSLPPNVDAGLFDVEISLKKHAFLFGAKIEEFELGLDPPTMYERIYNSWFDAAAIQAYKWKFNKGDRYNPDFTRATVANEVLLRNGKTVRGHSILWDIPKNVPDWVKALDNVELLPVINAHVKYMMNLTKDKIVQFDVQNEHIHGHYYEEKLQNPNVSKMAFTWAKAENANGPKLYLNDFQCVTAGGNTEDLYDLGTEYLAEGIPIEGLGIQGHTKDFVKPDPTAMMKRLDRLGSVGIDLMMSEFDIGWPDKAVRADWLEDSIRTFFGHPSLKGVILWGFWNGSMREPDHELVTGPTSNDITVVESGERWACLVRREWTTEEKFNLGVAGTSLSVRGFHGDYDLVVRRDGVPVQLTTLTLGADDVTMSVPITASTAPITLPTPREDFTPDCISHRDETKLATESLAATPAAAPGRRRRQAETLSCRTASSRLSGLAEDAAVSVSCEADEVMTGCSSYHMPPANSVRHVEGQTCTFNVISGLRRWTRKGEKVDLDDSGRVQCTAVNGKASNEGVSRRKQRKQLLTSYGSFDGGAAFPGSIASTLAFIFSTASGSIASTFAYFFSTDSGVRAYARCCKVSGMTCDYHSAGPSLVFSGAKAEARCGEGKQALGCSAFQQFPESHSINPRGALASCVAESGKPALTSPKRSGVNVFAACCSAPGGLDCQTVTSNRPSKLVARKASSVKCPDGFVMTGCSAFAADGKAAGARIIKNRSTPVVTCKAYLGADLPAGSTGVTAYATCCRMTQ